MNNMFVQSTPVISTSLISNNRLIPSANLVPVLIWKSNNRWQNIVEKRSLRSNFSSFPQYFQFISNFKRQITESFVKCGCSIYFFPQFCKSDMSRYGYLEVFQSPLDFEITRVDCISQQEMCC